MNDRPDNLAPSHQADPHADPNGYGATDPTAIPSYVDTAAPGHSLGSVSSPSNANAEPNEDFSADLTDEELIADGHLTELGALIWADDLTALAGLIDEDHLDTCYVCIASIEAARLTVTTTTEAIAAPITIDLNTKNAAITAATNSSSASNIASHVTSFPTVAVEDNGPSAKPPDAPSANPSANPLTNPSTAAVRSLVGPSPVTSLAGARAKKASPFTATRWLAAAACVAGATFAGSRLINQRDSDRAQTNAALAAATSAPSAPNTGLEQKNAAGRSAEAETTAAAADTTTAAAAASVAADTTAAAPVDAAAPAESAVGNVVSSDTAAPPPPVDAAFEQAPTSRATTPPVTVADKAAPKDVVRPSTRPPISRPRSTVVPPTTVLTVPVDRVTGGAPASTVAPGVIAAAPVVPGAETDRTAVEGSFQTLDEVVAVVTRHPEAYENLPAVHRCNVFIRSVLGVSADVEVHYAEIEMLGSPVVVGLVRDPATTSSPVSYRIAAVSPTCTTPGPPKSPSGPVTTLPTQ
jgi:hypothetical protein